MVFRNWKIVPTAKKNKRKRRKKIPKNLSPESDNFSQGIKYALYF